eukprot:TRINITY_DN3849_c0_g3_i1.p1 TRINITY_DN3849_c0_g3~~TRINITY_DN3849_c0_g3_i1.p1  ORF type:complete len:275 (+),score=16.03 TRINITY_DN3849_c0_g3_i1:105-929(+)
MISTIRSCQAQLASITASIAVLALLLLLNGTTVISIDTPASNTAACCSSGTETLTTASGTFGSCGATGNPCSWVLNPDSRHSFIRPAIVIALDSSSTTSLRINAYWSPDTQMDGTTWLEGAYRTLILNPGKTLGLEYTLFGPITVTAETGGLVLASYREGDLCAHPFVLPLNKSTEWPLTTSTSAETPQTYLLDCGTIEITRTSPEMRVSTTLRFHSGIALMFTGVLTSATRRFGGGTSEISFTGSSEIYFLSFIQSGYGSLSILRIPDDVSGM